MGDMTRRIQDYFNWRIEVVAKRTRDIADQIYQDKVGLSIEQLRVLRLVAADSLSSVGDITQESRLERTRVSRLLGSLVEADLIVREVSAKDARSLVPRLTAKGAKLLRQANRIGDALDQDFRALLTHSEIEQVASCLDRLAQWEPKLAD